MAKTKLVQVYERARARMLSAAVLREKALDGVYASIAKAIKAKGESVTQKQIAALFAARFKKRMKEIEATAKEGAAAGAKVTGSLEKAAGVKPTTGNTKRAFRVANARIQGRSAGNVRRVPLTRRLRRWDKELGDRLGREVTESLRHKEGMIGAAERIQKIDKLNVEVPKYVQDIADKAKAHGGKRVKRAAKSHINRIARISKDGSPTQFNMRSATRKFMRDVQKAHPQDVDALVDEWVKKKAAYRARVIARHETVEAYRETHIQSASRHPDLYGFQWSLAGRHPKPDICDVHATSNVHGLGTGIHAPGAIPVRHVACICGISAVYKRAQPYPGQGKKEPRIKTLKDMPAEKRKQILGPTRNLELKRGKQVFKQGNGSFRSIKSLAKTKAK